MHITLHTAGGPYSYKTELEFSGSVSIVILNICCIDSTGETSTSAGLFDPQRDYDVKYEHEYPVK